MKIKRPKFQLNCEIYNFVPQKYADRSKNFKAFLMHATKMFRLGGKKKQGETNMCRLYYTKNVNGLDIIMSYYIM